MKILSWSSGDFTAFKSGFYIAHDWLRKWYWADVVKKQMTLIRVNCSLYQARKSGPPTRDSFIVSIQCQWFASSSSPKILLLDRRHPIACRQNDFVLEAPIWRSLIKCYESRNRSCPFGTAMLLVFQFQIATPPLHCKTLFKTYW